MTTNNPQPTTRPIKFRAWSKDTKHMYQVVGMNHPTEVGFDSIAICDFGTYGTDDDIATWLEGDEYELMQYTGCKDKNGIEIYEQDIVRGAEYPEPMLEIQYIGKPTEVKWSTSYKPGFDFPQDCEVIGNIYENPELIK